MYFQLFCWLLVLWFLWEKVFKMYYRYWYYTIQGIKATSFPLPLIGNSFKIKKIMNELNEYSDQIFYEYCKKEFNGEKFPPIFVDFVLPKGHLIVSDPDIINEIFITKAKYFDKLKRVKNIYYPLTGESILDDLKYKLVV